jgi:FHA domain
MFSKQPMSNPKPSAQVDSRTLTFLEQHPAISRSLIADLGSNLSHVATLIEPLLDAPQRCEICDYYIQALTTGRTAFLTTNLPDLGDTVVTDVSTSWLIGRSDNCAIAILDKRISRCHAAIGHLSDRGFYIMDLGSSNGTFVNRSRLTPLEQRFLSDGDLVEFSRIRVELFISGQTDETAVSSDTQH